MKSYYKISKNFYILLFTAFIGFYSLYLGASEDSSKEVKPILQTEYNLKDLEGVWVRKESNNPSWNGLQVEVKGNQGILINKAGSRLKVGDTKWSVIKKTATNTFSYKELGSDYNNYPAKIVFTSKNTLEIIVIHSGAGNSQKWVRKGAKIIEPVKGELAKIQGKWKLIKSNGSGYDGMQVEIINNEAKIISRENAKSYKEGATKWVEIKHFKGTLNFGLKDISDTGVYTAAVIIKTDKSNLQVNLGSSVKGNVQTWQRVTSNPILEDTYEIDPPPTAVITQVLPCEISEDMVLKDTPAEVDYIVNDNCVINVTGRLRIESGVVIEFGKDAGIGINGNAEFDSGGGQKETILRGKENKSGYWRGIHIETDFEDSIEIINTKILNAGSKSVYSQNTKASIYYVKGNIEIFNNTIAMSGGCGFYYDSKIASLTNTIINNQIKFYENVEGDICGLQPKPLMGNYEQIVLRKRRSQNEVDYIVQNSVTTKNLVVDAGVIVEFEKEAGLNIIGNGQLSVKGESQKEVILRGKEARPGYWRGIYIDTPRESKVKSAKILHAGGDNSLSSEKAAIHLRKGSLKISNSTIEENEGCLVSVAPDAKLYNSGGNNFKIIDFDKICYQPKKLPCQIFQDMTLNNTPGAVDYIVDCVANVRANLVIKPGVVIEFSEDAGLSILGRGNLMIDSRMAPVILQGKEKRPGYWRGIHIETDGSQTTKMENVKIHNAGSNSTYLEHKKAAIYLKKGNIKLNSSTISNNNGCGVFVDPEYKDDTTFTNNSFENNTNGDICLEPKVLPCEISQDTVLKDTPAEVDYVVSENCVIYVTAHLDIEPGVVIEFEKDAGLDINKNGQLTIYQSGNKKPILRGKENMPAYWRGIHIETDKRAHIRDAHILNAGSKSVYENHKKASIHLKRGDIFFYNNRIGDSGGCGIYIDPTNSDDIQYSNNTFYGNKDGDICLEPKVLPCEISGDTVLKDTPAEVDYIVNDDCIIEVTANLKIDPGVVIEFGKDAGIGINNGGELLARDVVLRGKEAKVGYWRGIHVETDNIEALEIHATKVLHAGSKSVYPFHKKAAVNIKKGGLILENCTIAMSGGCGIYWDPEAYTGQPLGINNIFYENAEGHACVEPKELSGGNSNIISLSKRRGPGEVDYIINGQINVGGKLIVTSGVIIEFSKDAGISIVNGGEIDISGEPNKEVILRGKEAQQGYWRGIHLSGDVRHSIQYAKIEHTGSRPVLGGEPSAIHLLDGFLSLKNATISQSAGCGIFVSPKGTLSESNITFTNNKNGDMCNKPND